MYLVKAEANQIEKIVAMSVRAFETDVNVGGIKGDCPPEYDSIKWHQQMAREGHLYQAMIGNDLVGAAIVFPDETENSVYIGRIFIDSIYHRKGFGIRLMDCIEKNFPWAAEFHLDTPCWNERTNAFYKRLGYHIIKNEDGFIFYQKRKNEPMEKLTENMIHFAESKLGSTEYAGWCLAFIEDALEISNDIEVFGRDSAKEPCEMYKDALRGGVPERGAFVFYDCLCPSENGPVNWGHCGISFGDGRVIHAWDMVRVDDYLAIEKLTALTGNHPKYLGWVALERVLNQKPSV